MRQSLILAAALVVLCYFCPLPPAQGAVVIDNETLEVWQSVNFQGPSTNVIVSIIDGHVNCTNFSMEIRNSGSSINTEGASIQLFKGLQCSGASKCFHPNQEPGCLHSNLATCKQPDGSNWNKNANSARCKGRRVITLKNFMKKLFGIKISMNSYNDYRRNSWLKFHEK